MTFNELYYFIKGEEDRRLNTYRAVRLGAYSLIQSFTKKRIRPEGLFELPGDNEREVKRSEISAKEHLELVQKWAKAAEKLHGKQ